MTTLILIITCCLLLALVYYYRNNSGLTSQEIKVLQLLNELWGPQIGTDEQTLNRSKEILTELAKIPSYSTPHFPANLVNNITSAATAFLDCFELLEQQNKAIGQSRNHFWQLRIAIGEWTRFSEPNRIRELIEEMRKNPIFEEPII